MKALFIGGTGTISTEISKLCVKKGWDLTLLNRVRTSEFVPEGAKVLKCDIHDEQEAARILADTSWDVVADFIAFTTADVERDIRLFTGKTAQYFFISSASAYQKPLASPFITESTPLHNPYWEYSRNKAACEQILTDAYNNTGFPITLIRPSHTYCERTLPLDLHGPKGPYQILERIRQGKKVIIPGDGTTFWTVTHSRDFAVAFVGLMGNIHAIGEAYQITSDESLTWNQIHTIVAKAMGKELHAVHIATETLSAAYPEQWGGLMGDKSNSVMFDNTKIKRAVPEFCATTRFDQGARESVEYILSHPECQIPDPEFDAWCDAVIAQYETMVSSLPRFPD